jgi:hypothetical protein
VVAALVLVLIVAACGSSTAAVPLVKRAVSATLAARTVAFTVQGGATAGSASAKGTADFADGVASLTVSGSSSSEAGSGPTEVVVTGDALYVQSGPSGLATGLSSVPGLVVKPWVELPAALVVQASMRSANQLGLALASGLNPLQWFTALEHGVVSASDEGVALHGGVALDELTGSLDLALAARRAGASDGAMLRLLAAHLGGSVLGFDMLVDLRHHVVSLGLRLPGAAASGGAGPETNRSGAHQSGAHEAVTLRFVFSSFGTAPAVGPPPADQVTNLAAVRLPGSAAGPEGGGS